MRKMKIIIAVIMTMALLLLIAGCSQKMLSVDNYNKTIQQLCNDNDFKTKILSYLQKDPLGFFVVGLHSYNISMFENSSPKCDLSDTNNICFKNFVKVEAVLNIAKEQKILIDATPFYIWKEAVLNGKNIQPYLDDLLDKNFSPLPSFSNSYYKTLYTLYTDSQVDYYCGCQYSFINNKPVINPECPYKPRKDSGEYNTVEYEHIVPKSYLKQNKRCSDFEKDLHNLIPVLKELNRDRGNRPYGIVAGEERLYGGCDFEVDFKTDIVEVRESIRGDIYTVFYPYTLIAVMKLYCTSLYFSIYRAYITV